MIDHHFIYVFCMGAKEALVKRGYRLVQEDARQGIFIFENKGGNPFPDGEFEFVLSDTLSL